MRASLVDPYDCVLLDLDGTLFEGDVAIQAAPRAVARLRELGKRPIFMTNNSSRTVEAVASKLSDLGFLAAPREIVTSSGVTSALLASRGVRSAFVVGESGVREALVSRGIEVVGPNGHVDCVVVGWDRGATYERLRDACVHVQRGAALVATNPDPAFPAGDALWPGAGALLAVITTTTGAVPEVVGKPFPAIFEASLEAAGGERPLVVGDRLDTDIAGAADLGWDSLLVLSGITSLTMLEDSPAAPTYIGEDVSALHLPPERFREAHA